MDIEQIEFVKTFGSLRQSLTQNRNIIGVLNDLVHTTLSPLVTVRDHFKLFR